MGPGTPIAGEVIANEGRFQQIVLGERIVTVSTMKRSDRIFLSVAGDVRTRAHGQRNGPDPHPSGSIF